MKNALLQILIVTFFGLGSPWVMAAGEGGHDHDSGSSHQPQRQNAYSNNHQSHAQHMKDHSGQQDHSSHSMQMNHDSHGQSSMQNKPVNYGQSPIEKLDVVPASGKSREAGFDSRYQAEAYSDDIPLAQKCAQASRGIIALDNDSWKSCGGKPKGIAKGPGFYPAMPPWNKKGTGPDEAPKMDHSAH